MAWLRVGNERPCTDWNEIVFLSMSDKLAVVELRERAQQLMEAAEAAAAKGVLCSETTVLVRHDGSIHMAMDSDWPLDSLARERCRRHCRQCVRRQVACGRLDHPLWHQQHPGRQCGADAFGEVHIRNFSP